MKGNKTKKNNIISSYIWLRHIWWALKTTMQIADEKNPRYESLKGFQTSS